MMKSERLDRTLNRIFLVCVALVVLSVVVGRRHGEVVMARLTQTA